MPDPHVHDDCPTCLRRAIFDLKADYEAQLEAVRVENATLMHRIEELEDADNAPPVVVP